MTDETIFASALEKANPAELAAFLTEVCGDDAPRRRHLEGLLAAHAGATDFLERPAAVPQDPAGLETRTLGQESGAPANDEETALAFLAPPNRPDSLGRIGHYEVLEILGKGGFGIVFRALDEVLRRVVALKVLAPAIAATSPARKRFLREARSSAQVRHENVVQVYAVEEQPLPYLVMEFIPGETLQQRLDRTGPLETPEIVRIGRQIAEGLAAAHATGLIHRDIKPGNILLEGGHQRVKITDFGLARAADDASISQSGILAGTPMYMAPEQAKGEILDHRADLFSLGSVLYVMASGRPPFRASTTYAVLKRVVDDDPRPIQDVIPEAPQWLCEIIARLQAKKRDDRFASAQEVADLLEQRMAQMQHQVNVQPPPAPVAAPAKTPPSPPIPQGAPERRRPRFRARRWAAVAALFVLLVAGLGFTEATGVTNVHGTVVRLFSPEGTLVVEVDDPGVSVKIDGSDVVITGAGAKEIRLRPGRYTVEASKDGKLVSRELVTVTRNGRQVVRVSQEAAKNEPIAQANDSDRRAAEYVLSLCGTVMVNDLDHEIKALAELPKGAFQLTGFSLDANLANKPVTDAGLAAFKGCKNLKRLDLYGWGQATDAGLAVFKDCKNLDNLLLHGTSVTDAGLVYFKDCKNLTNLDLWGCAQISDSGLAYFKGCKNIYGLQLGDTKVSHAGLAVFKDCKNLTWLLLGGTEVSDAALAYFKDCKNLTYLQLDRTPITDAGLPRLAGLDKLTNLNLTNTKVTANGVEELAKALPKCKIEWDGGVIEPKVGFVPFTDADVKRIAALPAAEQVEEVLKELKRRNPQFDGALNPTSENDAVIGLSFMTDHVTDLSPLRALIHLHNLQMRGSAWFKGSLTNLTPLHGLPLTKLVLTDNGGVVDLSALKGMPLTKLDLTQTGVTDLTALHGLPLESLMIWGYLGTDLTPLQGMPLKWLNCGGRGRKINLAPLAGLPLEFLCINLTQTSDLTPLKDLPLSTLLCSNTSVSDLAALRGKPLKQLQIFNTKVSDLSPLKGMPLAELECQGSGVTNLAPLKDMPLTMIQCDFQPERDAKVLRAIKTLKTINDKPAEEFWKSVEKK